MNAIVEIYGGRYWDEVTDSEAMEAAANIAAKLRQRHHKVRVVPDQGYTEPEEGFSVAEY